MPINYGKVWVGFLIMIVGIGLIVTNNSSLMVLGGFIAGFSMTIILSGMSKNG